MMIIPEYCKSAFEITDTDNEYEILNKKYLIDRYNIGRKIQEQEQSRGFDEKYNEIKRMKNGFKSTIEQLKLQLAVESLLNE